jgi:hypothetical protein
MTQNPAHAAQVLAEAMSDATESHGGLPDGPKANAQDVAQSLIDAIRANTERGAELRAALGVELSVPTRMGKNLKAAMDAYTTP